MEATVKDKPKAGKGKKEQSKSKEAALQHQVDAMFPNVMQELSELLTSVKGLDKRLDKMGGEVHAARKEVKEVRKVVDSELDMLAAEEIEEISTLPEDAGRIRRLAHKGVNLLPRNRRERGQFMAGVVVGSSTNVLFPVGIIAASIARGRVIVSSN